MTTTSTQATQTDLEPLIALACEMLVHELQDGGADDAIMKRIRDIVERILARCRQSGCTLKGLVGVVLGNSPTKNSTFIDMHAEANDRKSKKSYHFHITEMTETQKMQS